MILLNKMQKVHQKSEFPPLSMLYREILEYYGYSIPPEIAYGITFGIGMEYWSRPMVKVNSDYKMNGIYFGGYFSSDRKKISTNLRIWLDVYKGDKKNEEFTYIFNYLKMGRPIVVEVNINLYWNFIKINLNDEQLKNFANVYNVPSNYFLNGFFITVIGYDEEKENYLCLDSYLEDLIIIPRDLFEKMCYYADEYIKVEGERVLMVVPRHKNIINIEVAVIDSIKLSIREIQNPYRMQEGYYLGEDAFFHLLEDFRTDCLLLNDDQLKESIKLIYFNSEIAVHKTGLHRTCYAEFLETSSGLTGNMRLRDVSRSYRRLGNKWSILLNNMLQFSTVTRIQQDAFYDSVYPMLSELIEEERQAILELKACVE